MVQKELLMIKTIFKLALCVLVYTVINSVIGSVLPYSQGFMEMEKSGTTISLLFIIIFAAWICFAMFFITKHTDIRGKKLYLNLTLVTFLITSLMTQIETVLFGSAFPALTRPDVLCIMLASLCAIAVTALPVTIFFGNKNSVPAYTAFADTASVSTGRTNAAPVKWEISIKNLLVKLGIIGIVYFCLYFLFGYFVAWQFSALREFYTGSAVNNISRTYTASIVSSPVVLFLIQIVRGILFGAFIIPLRKMINTKPAFIISVCLVYLSTGMQLIIPNPLFPDIVRYAHLIEMTGSMLLFGLAAGFIFCI